jgi:hypothetical protein
MNSERKEEAEEKRAVAAGEAGRQSRQGCLSLRRQNQGARRETIFRHQEVRKDGAATARARQNEGRRAFTRSELATYGWTVPDAIRFALDHLRKQQHESVTLESRVRS